METSASRSAARPVHLTPAMIRAAYAQGAFPMADSRESDTLAWYTSDPRAVLPLHTFHIPHGLRRTLKKQPYVVTLDRAFAQVIRACAAPRAYENNTWINDLIIEGYVALHEQGGAHSVEAWSRDGNELVGGLYGVTLGGAFVGESMFSRADDASKICLVHLVEHLRQRGFVLLDAQIPNDHLAQFGLQLMPHHEYLQRLHEAMQLPVTWGDDDHRPRV